MMGIDARRHRGEPGRERSCSRDAASRWCAAWARLSAMQDGSADRYFQEGELSPKKLVPEGIEGRVPYKGPVADVLFQMVGGLRSGMGYVGCGTIDELRTKTRVRAHHRGGPARVAPARRDDHARSAELQPVERVRMEASVDATVIGSRSRFAVADHAPPAQRVPRSVAHVSLTTCAPPRSCRVLDLYTISAPDGARAARLRYLLARRLPDGFVVHERVSPCSAARGRRRRRAGPAPHAHGDQPDAARHRRDHRRRHLRAHRHRRRAVRRARRRALVHRSRASPAASPDSATRSSRA